MWFMVSSSICLLLIPFFFFFLFRLFAVFDVEKV